MLQNVLVKRIERMYRLRLIYGIHLALFGTALVSCALNAVFYPTALQNSVLVAALWLPVVLTHTAAQSLYELRERCVTYEPVPVKAFNSAMPVIVYDEQGNRIGDGEPRLAPRNDW